MDAIVDNSFYDFDQKGQYLGFYNCPITSLYRLDIKEAKNKGEFLIVTTINGIKDKYTSLECTRARKIGELQHVLACPSNNDLANAIENNAIGKNSFAWKYIKISDNSFGPSVPELKGKTMK